jgi:hypothetical protein
MRAARGIRWRLSAPDSLGERAGVSFNERMCQGT